MPNHRSSALASAGPATRSSSRSPPSVTTRWSPSSVDFAVIKEAMATLQQVYVERTVEVPLYYRKNVDLHATRVGNFFANPTQAGPTWNIVDWFVTS